MPDLNRQATGANVEGYGEITAEAMKLGLTLQELEAISKALGQSTEDILKNSKSIKRRYGWFSLYALIIIGKFSFLS